MEISRKVPGFVTGIVILLALCASTFAQVDVLTQHNDNARTGANLNETVLKPANVNPQGFGLLFRRTVDDQVYGQPLYLHGVEIAGARRNVVYVTTVNNSVYAYDADDAAASRPYWHVNFGTAPSFSDGNFGCLDMNGNMGIVGTPVIDAQRQVLYVVALTHEGDGYVQRLHALDVRTGADQPGSPTVIVAPDFDALRQNQRPALLLSQGTIYIGYSSHCDKGPYHGFLLAYDAGSLKQKAVFNTTPEGEEGSIWQSGQGPAADAEGNVYAISGNGSWNGTVNFGESFLRLSPALRLMDWFTPSNYEYLNQKDMDLNSSGAMLIPGTTLVADGGKQGVLYLVNGKKMGHLGDANAAQRVAAGSNHIHSLVFWESAAGGRLLYMWPQGDHLKAYRFSGDNLETVPAAMRPEVNSGHPGAMLSLSANGGKDGILWAAIQARGDAWHASQPGVLRAFDASDVNRELWNSVANPRDDCGNYSKMAPPTISNGKVYLASFGLANIGAGELCVYGLLPGSK